MGHQGSKLAYNTVYKIDNAFYLEDDNSGGASNDFEIRNNIISPTVSYFTNVGTTGRFAVTYNLFRSTVGAPYGSGTGNITSDPLFTEPDGPSMYGLMLDPLSPCFNAGMAVTGITSDFLGKSRNETTPTLGAFEELMECTWEGTVNVNWHNYLNWKLKIVPKDYMKVIIPDEANDPVISGSNANCKSVQMGDGASLTIDSPRTLTVEN
jgi:hypothetical protein